MIQNFHRIQSSRKILILGRLNLSSRIFNQWLVWIPYFAIVTLKRVTNRDEYLQVIQSQVFLIRANSALEKNKSKRSVKFLKVAMHLMGAKLSPDYKTNLISIYQYVLTNRDQHESLALKVVELTSTEIEVGDQDCIDTYYYLSKFLNWCGFLNAGYLARDKAISLSRSLRLDINSSNLQIETCCGAHLEAGNLEHAEEILRSFESKFKVGRFAHFNFYLNLMHSEKSSFINSGIEKFRKSEDLMHGLINGKKVALVGTGVMMGDYGTEIDSSDFVVRVKYAGKQNLPPSIRQGKRCDIAYLTTLTPVVNISAASLEDDFLKDLKQLKMLMVKDVKERHEFQGVPILYLANLRSVFPNGDLTSGMICLANLLRFNPSSVKLFGFDFFSAPSLYNLDLVSFYKREGWKLGDPALMDGRNENSFTERIKGHFWHDQIANFSFARNLFSVGAIEIEPVGSTILSMSPKDYYSQMEVVLRQAFLSR